MRRSLACLSLALAAMFLPAAAIAQVLYGSLVGTVVDPTGASIQAARITVTNPATGQSRESQTDDSGYYSFPTLPGGTYTVTVDHAGFSRFVRQDVAVGINAVVRVDVAMTVGTVNEQVAVNAASPVLQTDRADVHSDFSPVQLENLPTPPSRNFEQLLGTVPGFTPPGQTNSIAANPARGLSFNVNGASRNGVNVRIDGASMNQVWLNHLTAYVPALEAIDTVNVVTNSFDAEQGLAGGAAVNVMIKSGSNELHGSAFEFNNNKDTKADPFFLPAGQSKPKYVLNEFGGTLGGPIVRNKLFYFGSYEATRDRETGSTFTTVPTAAIRAGDMSASPTPIYDPNTGAADGSGRLVLPNNQVPASRQSPIAQKLVALTPFPNIAGLTNNYYAVGAYRFDRYTVDAKINYNASSKLTTYGRFGLYHYTMNDPPVFGQLGGPMVNTTAGFAGTATGYTYSGSVGATYVARPNVIVDGNFGFTLLDTHSEPIRLHENLGSDYLGIPGTNNGTQLIAGGWPSFQVSNYTMLGLPYTNWPINYYDPTFKYAVNANWTHGAHNVRFGGEIARRHLNHTEYIMAGASGGGAGTFAFSGGLTAIKGGASPNQFNSYADFLLGLSSTISKMQHPDWISTRDWADGLYLRDQWQASRRLTLTFGLRWEFYPMPTRPDRGGVERYDPKTDKMLICGIGSVPGDCGVSVSKRLFAPRAGIAYRASDTLVIRGGYGINYDPFPLAKTTLDNYPVMLAISLNGANSFVPAGTLAQGIPPLVAPSLGNGIIGIPSAFVGNTLPDNFIRGYIQSWNFSAQKQLGKSVTAQASYVGTRQVHQLGSINLNVGTPGGGVASQPFNQLYGRTAAVTLTGPVGGSHYDALQARIERRFSQGLQLQANYTWGKTIGICCNPDSEGSPAIQLAQYYNLNRSVPAFDRSHSFVASGVYELPFGTGKRFLNHGLGAALLGGWQTNELLALYSGLPFSVSAAATSLNAPGNTQRANQVKVNVERLGGIGATSAFYDPLAFAPVTTATFGSAGFDSLRGPGYVNLDAALFRKFKIRERWQLEFRAEAFNAANTPHFGVPNGNVSNLQLNPDGSVRNLGGFMTITTLSPVGASREGIDERMFRLGLHLRF